MLRFEKVPYKQFCEDMTKVYGNLTEEFLKNTYDSIKLPRRATGWSAGYDFYAPYDFVEFNGISGNVYTAIRRYHQDLGIVGLYGLMFFLGFFYAFFYLLVNKRSCFGLLLYAYIIAPIVEISIEERFFMSILTHSKIPIIILLYLGYIFFTSTAFRKSFSFIFSRRVNILEKVV